MAPLFLKRTPTVLSLNQLTEEDCSATLEGPSLLPPDALVQQIAGALVPKYAFAVRSPSCGSTSPCSPCELDALVPCLESSSPTAGDSDLDVTPGTQHMVGARGAGGHDRGDDACPDSVLQRSLLDNVLLALWEDCAERSLFRYDVTECATKLVPGPYGFIAQLNEGRASKKRPTEFRIDKVCQPFDDTKFNFKKAFMREVLFQFEPHSTTDASTAAQALGPGPQTCEVQDAVPAGPSPNLVLINVSPIEYGHVLLCPRVLDCLPQLVDPATVLLALQFAVESDNPYCRVGYNSLGAYATINHLHFQAYYLASPFPCERAPCALLTGLKRKRSNTRVSRLVNYPVNGFVIEAGDSLEEMAAVVGHACLLMQQHDVAHNLLITDSGTRVFLWPQCYAEKQLSGRVPEDLLATGVNPAVFEIAGHLVLKRAQDYEDITEDLAWRLLAEVSYPEDRFMDLAQACFS